MRAARLPVLLLALAAPALLAADIGRVDGTEGQVTTMTYHERIIIRVPKLAGPGERSAPPPALWKERRGPKCIAPAELAGALITQVGAVDLVLVGNNRLRAKLDSSCEPLDFYSGFYLKPAADGRICAGRDVIRSRSGMSCRIDTFRELKPVAAKAPKR